MQHHRTFTRTASLFSMSLILAVAAGCATQGYTKAEKTSRDLTKVQDDVVKVESLVKQTSASLKSLVDNPAPDLQPQYKTFASNVNSLETASEKASARSTDMKLRKDAYLLNWKQQAMAITNESLRETSLKRIDTLSERFDDLSQAMTDARDEFNPFLAQMEDLKAYLSNDLSMGGIDAIKDMANDTIDKQDDVIEKIEVVRKQLDALAKDLNTAGPPPPTEKPAPAS